MNKRLTAFLTALIIPLTFLLSACGSSALTREEYRAELVSATQEYAAAQMKVVSVMMDSESGDGYFTGDEKKFKESCKEFESAMKRIEKINPPDDYKARHKDAVKALGNEREWLKAVKDYTKADTPEKLEKADNAIQKAANYENSFPEQVFEIVKSLS